MGDAAVQQGGHAPLLAKKDEKKEDEDVCRTRLCSMSYVKVTCTEPLTHTKPSVRKLTSNLPRSLQVASGSGFFFLCLPQLQESSSSSSKFQLKLHLPGECYGNAVSSGKSFPTSRAELSALSSAFSRHCVKAVVSPLSEVIGTRLL